MTDITNSIAGVILAAGKGKRMELAEINKVTVMLGSKPIIRHITDFMRKISLTTIVVVVGHAKESVVNILKNEDIVFAEQKEQLGTGHALSVALDTLPPTIEHVFVVYGDDAVLYSEDHISVIEKLFTTQMESNAAMTFLTIEIENPFGLGRVVRTPDGKVRAIVEEKDATEAEKTITEINPGCFIFRVDFLRKYLKQVQKSPVTGEYYLTSLIDLAILNGESVETVKGGRIDWRGVNTKEELLLAEKLISK
jgi:bifunctional UDP-N-acetylglucosamine pyrophosphorylase/glucosamine-1-phosphate N-acetyltransferase